VKTVRGPMSSVIMGTLLALRRHPWQQWLSPVQSVALGLLPDRQHHSVHRMVKVEPDHIDHVIFEVGIGGKLERPLSGDKVHSIARY
jgi:hypothetical protein